jgi:hypothetical protein
MGQPEYAPVMLVIRSFCLASIFALRAAAASARALAASSIAAKLQLKVHRAMHVSVATLKQGLAARGQILARSQPMCFQSSNTSSAANVADIP